MDGNSQKAALRRTMNRNVQYFTGLKYTVDHPPHAAVGLLKDENIAWSNERHGRWLAQTSGEFANPQVGIAHRLSGNNRSETAEPERDPKPPAQIQLPPVVIVEHFEFAPIFLGMICRIPVRH
jgi:hypothetical protein